MSQSNSNIQSNIPNQCTYALTSADHNNGDGEVRYFKIREIIRRDFAAQRMHNGQKDDSASRYPISAPSPRLDAPDHGQG